MFTARSLDARAWSGTDRRGPPFGHDPGDDRSSQRALRRGPDRPQGAGQVVAPDDRVGVRRVGPFDGLADGVERGERDDPLDLGPRKPFGRLGERRGRDVGGVRLVAQARSARSPRGRPGRAGGIVRWTSNRPGRSRAGSSRSGRLRRAQDEHAGHPLDAVHLGEELAHHAVADAVVGAGRARGRGGGRRSRRRRRRRGRPVGPCGRPRGPRARSRRRTARAVPAPSPRGSSPPSRSPPPSPAASCRSPAGRRAGRPRGGLTPALANMARVRQAARRPPRSAGAWPRPARRRRPSASTGRSTKTSRIADGSTSRSASWKSSAGHFEPVQGLDGDRAGVEVDRRQVAAEAGHRGLAAERFEVGPDEPVGDRRQVVQVDVLGQRHPLAVDFEDLAAGVAVGDRRWRSRGRTGRAAARRGRARWAGSSPRSRRRATAGPGRPSASGAGRRPASRRRRRPGRASGAMASISSRKMMLGACLAACSKTSRSRASLSP